MPAVAPFWNSGSRSSGMALWALVALLIPAAIYSGLYRSPFIFLLLGYTLLGGVLDGLYHYLKEGTLRWGTISSGLTAALLVASVPPNFPFIPMFFAIIVAIWVVKLPSRGSPLRWNAALVGRLFLMLAYSSEVVAWGNPAMDVLSSATPQELYASEGYPLEWMTLLFGRIGGNWEGLFALAPGSPGETFPVVLLLIGVGLCFKGVIAWRAPVAFLLAFAAASAVLGDSVLFNLFSSATIFSAVFIISDPVSSPMSKGGKIAFGILVGVSNAVIRHTTYYTEAIVFAVLLGNLFSPLFDRIAFHWNGKLLDRRRQRGLASLRKLR